MSFDDNAGKLAAGLYAVEIAGRRAVEGLAELRHAVDEITRRMGGSETEGGDK